MKYIIAQTAENKAIAVDYTGTLKDGSVALTALNGGVMAEGTIDKLVKVRDQLIKGEISVFDTSTFTVKGAKLTTYTADVDDFGDYQGDTEVVKNGVFEESKHRSAPYFDLEIDGITRLNAKF